MADWNSRTYVHADMNPAVYILITRLNGVSTCVALCTRATRVQGTSSHISRQAPRARVLSGIQSLARESARLGSCACSMCYLPASCACRVARGSRPAAARLIGASCSGRGSRRLPSQPFRLLPPCLGAPDTFDRRSLPAEPATLQALCYSYEGPSRGCPPADCTRRTMSSRST
jgi:hypothetical protein